MVWIHIIYQNKFYVWFCEVLRAADDQYNTNIHYHSNIQGWLDVGCCFLFVCLKEINTVMHYIDQK